jgi:hypothetical protein
MKSIMEAILVIGIIFLCKFINWQERREQRYLAFEKIGEA